MGDLFHEDVPEALIDRAFAIMQRAKRHTFQVLTKRPDRMQKYMTRLYEQADGNNQSWFDRGFVWPIDPKAREAIVPFPNVWLGTSAEDQRRADERVPDLIATPAAVRFVSAEPLLGPLNFSLRTDRIELPAGLDWVIVGEESGHGARLMHTDWARSIIQQCQSAGVSVFMKQMSIGGALSKQVAEFPTDMQVREYPHV